MSFKKLYRRALLQLEFTTKVRSLRDMQKRKKRFGVIPFSKPSCLLLQHRIGLVLLPYLIH